MHRTFTTYDRNDFPVVVDIQDFSRAWEIRKVAEKYIATKLAQDLQAFENIDPESDYLTQKRLS